MKIIENQWKQVPSASACICVHPHGAIYSQTPEIHKNQKKTIKIHVLLTIGNVQASPHPPYFSKKSGTVPNATCDGNRYATKEVGGRGGARKYINNFKLNHVNTLCPRTHTHTHTVTHTIASTIIGTLHSGLPLFPDYLNSTLFPDYGEFGITHTWLANVIANWLPNRDGLDSSGQ